MRISYENIKKSHIIHSSFSAVARLVRSYAWYGYFIIMETKKCYKCGEVKPLNEFRENYKMKDGSLNICNKCENTAKTNRNRSKNGVVGVTYRNQIKHSVHRKHPLPAYTKEELKEWLFSQPLFHELYDKWVESGYDRWTKPSVDRIDDYVGYTLSNIQLMTSKENLDKSYKDKINGVNNKQSKAVLQYDLDGNFIKEHYSLNQAYRDTGINDIFISYVCRGMLKTAGNYVWKYSKDVS